MIPITTVRFGPEEEALVLEVLRSGQLAQGAYVEQLRAVVRASCHGVDTQSRSTTARRRWSWRWRRSASGRATRSITTPFTFVATLNAILEAGATVRFADIGDDFNVRVDAMAGRRHRAHEGSDAGAPVRLHGRHGSDHRARRSDRRPCRRGRGPGRRRASTTVALPEASESAASACTRRRTSPPVRAASSRRPTTMPSPIGSACSATRACVSGTSTRSPVTTTA